jgi:GTP pyrophosphokinase
MDVRTLEKFFDYTALIHNEKVLLDKIVQRASKYLPAEQLPFIVKAYEYAADKHKDQKRLSGEPYIIHPLRATKFLMDMKPDLETIQTCLLHDVIEDCDVTQREIEKEFGSEVGELCEGMVKVSKIKYK